MGEAAVRPFSELAWEASRELRRAIYTMPFNTELTAGTLSCNVFQHYMLQDSLYLRGYSMALALASSRCGDNASDQIFLAKSAATAVEVERSLHDGFLAKFGVTPEQQSSVKMSPTCEGYVNYLLATAAVKPVEELLAALLPCFWLYNDVGLRVYDAAKDIQDHPYQAWIDMYAGDAFGESVRQMKAIVDRRATVCTKEQQKNMLREYMQCARYEWCFWDAAYRLESWAMSAEPSDNTMF